MLSCSPSDPSVNGWVTLCSQCQALGQALIPLPSRERGILGVGLGLLSPSSRAVDTALKPV